MLKEWKKRINRWAVVAIIGLICLVFVFVGFFPTGAEMITGGNFMAKVDGEAITHREFENRFQQMTAQVNRKLSKEERQRIADSILNQLIQDKMIVLEARNVGFTVSDIEVMNVIKEQEYFKNKESKNFDVDLYRQLLANNGLRPADYEKQIKDELIRNRMVQFLNDRIYVTDDEVRREFLVTENKRNIRYIRVPRENAYKKMSVDAEKIKEYTDEVNAEKYNLVKNYYFENLRTYRKEKEACVRHIFKFSTTDTEEAKKAVEEFRKLKPSKSNFNRLAREFSDEFATKNRGGLMGCVEQSQIAATYGDDVAAKVFQMQEGQISDLITGQQGLHYFYVYELKPLRERKLEDVKAEIAELLLKRERLEEIKEINQQTAESIRSNWIAKNADTAAKQQGLQAEDTDWFHEMSVVIPGIGRSDKLFAAAFDNDSPVQDTPTLFESQGSYIVAKVVEKKVVESVTGTNFEEEKDKIREYLESRKRRILLTAWMQEVSEKYQPKIRRNQQLLESYF